MYPPFDLQPAVDQQEQGCPRVGSIVFLAIGWFGSVGSVGFLVCPGLLCRVFGQGGVGSVGSVSGSVRSVFGARPGDGQPWEDRGLTV